MSTIVKHNQPCPQCGSGDALQVYSDGSTYCFSANHKGRKDTQVRKGHKSQTQIENEEAYGMLKFNEVPSLPILALDLRGIDEAQAAKYGVRTEIDVETGHAAAYLFPLYKDGAIIGYQRKVAREPGGRQKKDTCRIKPEGSSSGETDPFGSHLVGKKGGFIIVVEGAEDALAASQMLLSLGKKYRVVATLGTDGWKKQIGFFDAYTKVAIAYDGDEGGRKAALEFAAALRPGQAAIVKLPTDWDCNKLLLKGSKGAERFLDAINNAKPYEPDGVITGDTAWTIIENYTAPECIPYPPEWEELNIMTEGMRRGEISMWTAGTGIGKTSFVRRIKQHIIQNTNWTVGDIELEESAAKTIRGMLQFQGGKRLVHMTQDEKRDAWAQTYGTRRIVTLDHRAQNSRGQSLMSKLKYLRYGHGCDVIMLDHITLAVSEFGDSRGMEQQDQMMGEFLEFVEQSNAHLCLISHIRKPPSGVKSWSHGAVPTEDDLKGSGSIGQISFDIIGVSRNKQHEDEYLRNVSQLTVIKCRETGTTGSADRLHWDRECNALVKAAELVVDGEEGKF